MSLKKIIRRISKRLSSGSTRSQSSHAGSLPTTGGSIDVDTANTAISSLAITDGPFSSEPLSIPVEGIESESSAWSAGINGSKTSPGAVEESQEVIPKDAVKESGDDSSELIAGGFPPELVEAILDYLLKDFKSLKSCALVCKNWLPSIRRRLFHSKTLDHDTNYGDSLAVLKASPGIADCVRDLDIRGDLGPCPWMSGLVEVCDRFLYVQSLQIRTIVFQFLDAETRSDLSRSINSVMMSVTNLSIQHVMFQDPAQLQEFIGSFPRITSVSVMGSGYLASENSIISSYAALMQLLPPSMIRPRVDSLRLVDCYSEVYRSLLQGTILNLRHLTLHTSVAQDADAPLDAAPETLENMESLSLRLDACTRVLCHLPSRLPALKTFVIEIPVINEPPYQISWLHRAIDNLPLTVSEIKFKMSGDVRNFDVADWESIDAAIGSRRFPVLKRVEVGFDLFERAVATEVLLKERLGKLKLSERGLLDTMFSYKKFLRG